MICPNCGENNSANFRFCGMCGTALEAPRRPIGAPRTASADAQRTSQNDAVMEDAARARTTARATAGAVHEPPATAGPSFLGLNQPFPQTNETQPVSGTSTGESFSGLDSFFEPDDPGVSTRGIIFLLLLLVGLGAGGWWAYTHYNGPKSGTAAQATTQLPAEQANAPEPAANNPATNPKTPEESASTSPNPSPSPGSSSNTMPSQSGAASPAESANSAPPPGAEVKSDRSLSITPKPAERNPGSERTSRNRKIARAAIKPTPRPSPATHVAGDKGDAEFKRGEAYLYGRGVPENCDQAIKNLKEASAKQNAKARSAFGTMYATGHCVPRNLPTSYSWFALALRADPNNQILEKDLTAVWNQMTPPERQVAARTKP